VGFNKKIVGKTVIQEISSCLGIIELYLRADSLIFEDEEIEQKFQELKNEFLKTNTLI
jgi:hypothetical protein